MSDEQLNELQQADDDYLDPGQLEGKQKLKASDKLEPGHDRFDKIYGKMKNFERENAALTEKLDSQTESIDAMKEHNQKMMDSIGRVEETQKEQVQIGESEIEKLETKLAEVSEEENFAEMFKIQNQITKLIVAENKINTDEIVSKVKETVTDTNAKEQNDKLFNDWVSGNDWYNSNEDAREYADLLGSKFLDKGESYDGMLKKVSEKTKQVFGISGEPKGPGGIPSVEAGRATEGTPRSQNTTSYKMNDREHQIAEMFGMTDQEYATQAQYLQKGDK